MPSTGANRIRSLIRCRSSSGAAPPELPPTQHQRREWDYSRGHYKTAPLSEEHRAVRLAYEEANKGRRREEGGISAEAVLHFGVDIRSSFKEFIEVAQKIGQSWHEAKHEAMEGTIPVNLGLHAGRNKKQSKKEGDQATGCQSRLSTKL